MKVAYLLVGQRGAGKSCYARKLQEKSPDLMIISLDDILVEWYGSSDTGPHGHIGVAAMNEVMDCAEQEYRTAGTANCRIIIDCWSGDANNRRYLISRLRDSGADRVIALYFVTPLEFVQEWFWKKPKIAKMHDMHKLEGQGFTFFCEDAPQKDFQTFHRLAENIDKDGFDGVIRVNPTDPLITL